MSTTIDPVEFMREFGVPLVIIAALAWFFVAKLWPFITAHITRLQDGHRLEREKFLESLAKLNHLLDEQQHTQQEMIVKYGQQFQYMTAALEELAAAMQHTLPQPPRNKKTQTPKHPRSFASSSRRTRRS